MYASDAERGALGSCMLSKTALDEVMDKLNEDDFSINHRGVYRVIKYLWEKGFAVDAILVAEKLQGNPIEFTTDLAMSVPTTQSVPHYIRLIAECSQRRKIHELGLKLQSMAMDQNKEIDDVLDFAEKEALNINAPGDSIPSMPDVVDQTMNYIEMCFKRKSPGGLKTGFRDLDYLLKGLMPGTLTIIAARPSMGKTAFALNIASNIGINNQKRVLFVSAEQTSTQITTRLLSSRCRIDNNKMKLGQLSDDDWKNLSSEAVKISNSGLVIDDKTAPKVTEIRSKARKVKADLVIIDHLTELWRERKKDDRIEHEQNIRDIKRMAKDLNIPIILLQQLNRGCEARKDRRPILSDLKETGSSEEVADIVIFLYRDDYYNTESDKKNIAEAIVAKGRDCGIGCVELIWLPQFLCFLNLER